MKIIITDKNLFLSLLLFVVSFWLGTYVFLPYFAVGGIDYMVYDLTNWVNVLINIVVPLLAYAVACFFANRFFKESLANPHSRVLWIVLIVLLSCFVAFLLFFGVMVVVVYRNIINYDIGYLLGLAAVINLLVWSIIALKKGNRKEKNA